jgi:hypothetical protein
MGLQRRAAWLACGVCLTCFCCLQLLDIVHPAAKILVDIARSQDAEVGDGTTTVVVLAGEFLKAVKEHVEQGVSSQIIIKGLRRAAAMAVNKIKEISVSTTDGNKRTTLERLAATAMTSKLIKRNTPFFTKSVAISVRPAIVWIVDRANYVPEQWLSTPCCPSTRKTSTRSS